MTKLTLLLALFVAAYTSQATTNTDKEDKTEYVQGKVYVLDGESYRFVGYDDKANPQFEGYTMKLPDYHGPVKRLIRHNRKAKK